MDSADTPGGPDFSHSPSPSLASISPPLPPDPLDAFFETPPVARSAENSNGTEVRPAWQCIACGYLHLLDNEASYTPPVCGHILAHWAGLISRCNSTRFKLVCAVTGFRNDEDGLETRVVELEKKIIVEGGDPVLPTWAQVACTSSPPLFKGKGKERAGSGEPAPTSRRGENAHENRGRSNSQQGSAQRNDSVIDLSQMGGTRRPEPNPVPGTSPANTANNIRSTPLSLTVSLPTRVRPRRVSDRYEQPAIPDSSHATQKEPADLTEKSRVHRLIVHPPEDPQLLKSWSSSPSCAQSSPLDDYRMHPDRAAKLAEYYDNPNFELALEISDNSSSPHSLDYDGPGEDKENYDPDPSPRKKRAGKQHKWNLNMKRDPKPNVTVLKRQASRQVQGTKVKRQSIGEQSRAVLVPARMSSPPKRYVSEGRRALEEIQHQSQAPDVRRTTIQKAAEERQRDVSIMTDRARKLMSVDAILRSDSPEKLKRKDSAVEAMPPAGTTHSAAAVSQSDATECTYAQRCQVDCSGRAIWSVRQLVG